MQYAVGENRVRFTFEAVLLENNILDLHFASSSPKMVSNYSLDYFQLFSNVCKSKIIKYAALGGLLGASWDLLAASWGLLGLLGLLGASWGLLGRSSNLNPNLLRFGSPKVPKRVPKGSQDGTKMGPKTDQNRGQNRTSKK